MTEDKFTFITLDKATVPPAGLIEHIKDHWWLVHPEKGVAFYGNGMAVQGNTNESLTRRFAESNPWAEVRFIPSVFRAINPQDYVY